MNELKICSTCKESKAKTEFSKKKRAPDGLNWQCKTCTSKSHKKYYQNHAEERRTTRREYYKDNREKELNSAREYRESHREETRAYAQRRRDNNPEYVRAINRASYERNKEKNRERARQKRKENPEYLINYKKLNREELNRKGREYVKNNRDIINKNTQKYRAKKAGAEGEYTVADIRIIYDQQQGLCYYCNQPVVWSKKHKDHKQPLSRGGSNWPCNIAVTCEHCNLSKNDKTEPEFWQYLKETNRATQ